jgi:hypothetical protein
MKHSIVDCFELHTHEAMWPTIAFAVTVDTKSGDPTYHVVNSDDTYLIPGELYVFGAGVRSLLLMFLATRGC